MHIKDMIKHVEIVSERGEYDLVTRHDPGEIWHWHPDRPHLVYNPGEVVELNEDEMMFMFELTYNWHWEESCSKSTS